MATVLNATALRAMLDGGFDPDGVSLHDDDPGVDGLSNAVKAAVAATFAAATTDSGTKQKRALSAAVEITEATASTNVVNIGIWGDTQSVYYGYITRTGGDAATNADGEYTLTTDTKLTVDNAS